MSPFRTLSETTLPMTSFISSVDCVIKRTEALMGLENIFATSMDLNQDQSTQSYKLYLVQRPYNHLPLDLILRCKE